MLLEHPAMVGEQLLEAETHGEDERQPQHSAEEHCRHHRLALGTQRLAGGVGGGGEGWWGRRWIRAGLILVGGTGLLSAK